MNDKKCRQTKLCGFLIQEHCEYHCLRLDMLFFYTSYACSKTRINPNTTVKSLILHDLICFI